MELGYPDVMRIARRRAWIVLTVSLVAGLAMLAVALIQDERYLADARVLVLPAAGAEDSYNALLTSQSVVETYRQMMESGTMFDRVIETLGLDYTRKELDRLVTTALLPGALLIEVSVEHEDPERAATIATTFVEQFDSYINEYSDTTGDGGGMAAPVEIAEVADVPDEPFAPRTAFLVVLGLFGGLLLGIGIVVALEIAAAVRRSEAGRTELQAET